MKTKRFLLAAGLVLALAFTVGCGPAPQRAETIPPGAKIIQIGVTAVESDPRDGKEYKTVIMGEQTWMAENLNYNAEGSKCYGEGGEVATSFDNKGNPTAKKTLSDKEVLDNCQKYGRLYDWNTAKEACPSGWHLPSDKEWQILVDFLGGGKVAGKKLKSKVGWNNNGNGTDYYKFSAMPGGQFASDAFVFSSEGKAGAWWGANDNNSAFVILDVYDDAILLNDVKEYASSLISVRCLRDSP